MEEPLSLKPGDIIKGMIWFGIVRDVFVSPTTGEGVIEVRFIKNAMMGDGADIVKLSMAARTIRRATVEELRAHLADQRREADERCDELMKGIAPG